MLTPSFCPAAGQITGDVRVSGHPKVQATFARVMGEHCTLCLAVVADAVCSARILATCSQTLAAHLLLPVSSLQHDTGKDLLRLCCQQPPEIMLQRLCFLAAANESPCGVA